jgi:hypothetical protein
MLWLRPTVTWQLPNGSDALIVRSVNGTSWDPAKNGTTSTLINPDKLTLTTYVSSASDMNAVKVAPILAESVIMEPVNDSVCKRRLAIDSA